MDSLTKELGNNESLTSLFGVVNVRVDDVVISNDYSDGYTLGEAIELAKIMGNDEISKLLLQIQQSPVDFIRFRDSDSNNNRHFLPDPDSTSLMIACCNNNSQLVKLLLDHNADPNIQTKEGYTALMYSTGNSKIFQMLLDRGADIKTRSFLNETVLHFACWAGNVKIVKTILERNRDFVHATSNNGYTPLNEACRYGVSGNTEIVRMLLQEKANPNIQESEGSTPLITASRYGYTAVVEKLLQAKADLNIQDSDGWTALMSASYGGHTAIVELLLQAKADLDIQDNEGWTALMNASNEGHIAVVELLLKAWADPNVQDNEGCTALLLASYGDYPDVVELLLQAKADPSIQDNEGHTVLLEPSSEDMPLVLDLDSDSDS